jgi:CoA:oxalate CoA-transferase
VPPVAPVGPVHRGQGPLSGVRVLDFSRVLSGPHCGRMLADMGADVIKVEPPEGDMTRYAFPRVNSIATYFTQQNCGKRNISLDLRLPRAVEILRELARRSHVVLENFRPGVMDRMGLGYEALAAEHPDLVYASLTGYGSTGPWSHRRAYAPVVGAESGLTWLQGEARGGSYANDPISHGDVYTALECLAAILAALYQRERTGRGQHVEVSMTATLLAINEHVHWELSDIAADGVVASFQPGDYPVFTVGDGRTVVVSGHPADRGTFERYAHSVGRPELIDDVRFGDVASRLQRLDELRDELQAGAGTFPSADELEASLAEQGLAMGVLRTVREVADSEWARARGAIVDVPDRGGGRVRIPNSPWHFSQADVGVRGEPAYRGEHNREVLRALCDLTDADLDQLESDGVLSSRLPS